MASLTTNAPLTGGLTPSGAIGNQLQAITRRAVVPSLFTQIYQSTPLLSMLLGNSQRAKGGVPQITIPAQGASFVQFAWSSFAGNFDMPQDVAAIQNAQFNLKIGLTPIGFFGMEALIQSSEVIIPKLRAVTSDAAVVIRQAFSQSLYANNFANTNALDSLYQAYDDGTNVPSYGGINKSGVTDWWSGQLYANAGGIMSRAGMAVQLTRVMNGAGGESPDFAVCNPSDWATLLADYINAEQITIGNRSQFGKEDSINSGFRALRVLDTPIFADPFCPRGQMYMINSRYLALYLSEYAPFVFSGFESAIPLGQIASIGVLIAAMNLVCAKPSSGAHFTGISGGGWTIPTGAPTVTVPNP